MNGRVTKEELANSVMRIEGLTEETGYTPSKHKETEYNVNGTETTGLKDVDVYAKRIIHGDSLIKHFIRVDSQGLPLDPRAKETNANARRFSTLLGTPQTRLVPVSPATFNNYVQFLVTGNMAKYQAACKV